MNNNDIANTSAGAATFSTTLTKQQQQQQQQQQEEQEEEEHRSNSTFLQDYDSDNDNDGNGNDNGNGNTNDNDDELSQTTNGTRQSQAQQDYATNGIGGGGIAIPPTNVTVNDSLSKELLKLSLYDRNAMEEEIHGVRSLSSYKVETPTLLQEKLIEFDIELQKIILIRSKKRKKTLQQKQKQQQKQSKVGTPNIKTKMKANNDNNEETTEDTDSDTDVLRNIIPMQSQSQQSQSSSSSSSSSQNQNEQDDEKEQDNEDEKQQQNESADEKKELCYVNDPDVRLRFLRCDSFDSKKAVKRFVSFLEFSTAIFGNFIADRPPKIKDVYNNNNNNNSNREEIRALQNSRAQYLPFRDRSGRRIHCLVGKVGFDLEFILRCKIVMYLHWIASEDIETQQKGIVVIAWPSDEDNYTSLWEKGNLRLKIKKQNTETFKQNFNVALPVRVTSIHFCSKNQPIYKVLSSLFYFSLNTHHKSRYKTHFGDTMEILYKLQSYGIPVDLLPMTYSGTVKTTAHSQWVTFRTTVEQQEEKQKQSIKRKQQQQQQQRARNQHEKQPQLISSSCNADVIDNGNNNANANQTAASNTSASNDDEDVDEIILVECPRSYDICFRKGKSFKNNPGNLHFRSLIEETHHSHFMLSDRKDKFDMTLKIADQIMNNTTSSAPRSNGSSSGGAGGAGGGGGGGQQMRILEWNKKRNAWLLVNDKFAIRQKVANSYKEYKRSCIGRQNALSTSTLNNKNANNANANNANANNAKSLSLVEIANNMINANITANATTTNNKNNNTETSGSSSGGRKNQRQFQQQQQQQKEEQQRDEYMFLQSKRQKITTTIPTPTTTASSAFLGEGVGSTNNCTGCFSFHHQTDGGSGNGSDSGNEDSNHYGNNNCNNSNKAYNWLL